MKTIPRSTRRRFFWKAGALLSAPLAATASGAGTDPVDEGDAAMLRLARLEDADLIRELHRKFATSLNAGAQDALAALFADPAAVSIDASIDSLSADRFGEPESIDVAADGRKAQVRLACTVHSATPINAGGSLAEMARQQGEGCVRESRECVLETVCVKRDGLWKIARAGFAET